MERRQVLIGLLMGGSATAASLVGIPVVIYAIAPGDQDRQAPQWREIGRLENFPLGSMTDAVIQRASDPGADRQSLQQGVYVWRASGDEVVVFSRSCTDLGCPVTFDQGSHCFFCPCHGGIFNRDGERMAGPPDRPLYRYAYRVVDGVLQVDLSSVPPMV